MTYNQKANEIIKESIKSAIFIDENARDFYTETVNLTGAPEEQISLDLYSNFKENGISLAVHKYRVGDESKDGLKTYLFEDRDLVLLDWNLEGNSDGQDKSLELLSDIVTRPHIHFCTIYTSDSGSKLDNVFSNILSYFSDENQEFYDDLKEEFEEEADVLSIIDALNDINLNRNSKAVGGKIGKLIKAGHLPLINRIEKFVGDANKVCALSKVAIALNDNHKSPVALPCPTTSSFEQKSLVINNTIITILNKNENKPDVLIQNLSNQIVESKSSFTQLLGLEMQSIFSKSSAFIDENLIHSSKDAILSHRAHYKEEGMEHLFPEFIKDIMLEKAKLNIRDKSLSLLDDSFLNSQTVSSPEDAELISMNVFYNSAKKAGMKQLNFGDVFKLKGDKEYYICITALCDCLRPNKIDNRFFFAKGITIKNEDALKLGDSAFISFIDNKTVIKWTDVVQLDEDGLHKYSPVYVKPVQFTVVNPEFDTTTDIDFKRLNSSGDVVSITVNYLTTIKANYTQRIANHAFSHPVRVGVDFVTK